MITPHYRNPHDPTDYYIWEDQGFEQYWVGMFTGLRPQRKLIGFMSKEFIEDNARLGIKVGFDGKQFYGTFNITLCLSNNK